MFLQKVYKEWRALFWIIMAFIFLQAFFMAKGIENAPFFLYSMFATTHPSRDSFPALLIKTPDGYISPFKFSNREAELLTNNVALYNALKKDHYSDIINETIEKRFKKRLSPSLYQFAFAGLSNDSIAACAYPAWWTNYFTSITPERYDSVSLVISYVRFQPGFSKSPVDSVIFTTQVQ